jgi:diguanylate cyclase (GGDEF)-like protein
LIPKYQAAIRSLRENKFGHSVPVDVNDEITKLGHELNHLALELERKFSEASKLREISKEINSGLFLDDILNRAFDSFHTVIPFNRMGCALLNDEKTEAVAYWVKTNTAKVRLTNGHKAEMAGSSLQMIITTGKPRILNDLQTYLIEHPKSISTNLIVEEGMCSSLTCPLIADSKPVGFLFFSSIEKNTYQDIHQDIFLQIAGQISSLIEKSRLYQQLHEFNQKLLLAQQELQHQATHDALTGIYNRRAIIEHLDAQLARAKRFNKPIGAIVVDVDHFKQFNDTFGHLAGDQVLKIVSIRMKECLREYDYIGRYGGEEFLVVLGDANYETAVNAAERLRQAVCGEAIILQGQSVIVTISAGIVVAENCAEIDSDAIISAADTQAYKAKANGRNRFEFCRI